MSKTNVNNIIFGAIFDEEENTQRLLVKATNFTSLGHSMHYYLFLHKNLEEICTAISREIVKKTPRGVFYQIQDTDSYRSDSPLSKQFSTQVVEELQKYKIIIYTASIDNLSIVFISNINFPDKNLGNLCIDVLNRFRSRDTKLALEKFTFLQERLNNTTEYSEPGTSYFRENNDITRIQEDVAETKQILCKSIAQILDNNDKLEDLLLRSEDLSKSSQLFLRRSKKLNRKCCQIL